MNYKIKPIVWKEFDGVTIGFVGGRKLFSYGYNMNSLKYDKSTEVFKLTNVIGYPPNSLASRQECEQMAQALLQKHIAALTE
jgi:hypothetical protein